MRDINEIFIHCSDTPDGKNYTMKDVDDWHTWPRYSKSRGRYRYKGKWYDKKEDLPEDVRYKKGNGWIENGYNYGILVNGDIEEGRPLWKVGSHVRGHNKNSIGIVMFGREKYSDMQWTSLKYLVGDLLSTYPKAEVKGHYQADPKKPYCPGFNVPEWFQEHFMHGEQFLDI